MRAVQGQHPENASTCKNPAYAVNKIKIPKVRCAHMGPGFTGLHFRVGPQLEGSKRTTCSRPSIQKP